MRRLFLLALILVLQMAPVAAFAQKADPALQGLAFLSGRWSSDSADGQEEEYWSPATGKSMVGTFRVVKDGDAVFYEFWVIEVEGGKALFKMKHFDRGLVGWEEKADMVRLAASLGDGQDVTFPNRMAAFRFDIGEMETNW